jgi:hypothetical protein
MRFYTDEPLGAPAPPPEAPEPGTGTVFVMQMGDGTWDASWQAGDRIENLDGVTEAQAKEWARSRRAQTALVFHPEVDDYRPL